MVAGEVLRIVSEENNADCMDQLKKIELAMKRRKAKQWIDYVIEVKRPQQLCE